MDIKIKKDDKVKKFKLISKWSDVTLEKWLKLAGLEKGSKTKEAQETIAALSNIPKQLINQLSIKDVAVIMSKIAEMQHKQDSSLKNIIKINDVEYGFHPNLEEITLGEYADIETFLKNDIQNNLPQVMAVLYRPITEKKNKIYNIKSYDGNIRLRAEEMKKMSAEQVQSALVFFWSFVTKLLPIMQLYLTEMQKEMKVQ